MGILKFILFFILDCFLIEMTGCKYGNFEKKHSKKQVFYRTPKNGFGDLKKRPNALKCLKNDSSDLRNL
jgi:hypothetical protein